MKKILVVEDDKDIAMALALRLRAAGFTVLSAFDAHGGVTMVLRELPDLVLLDLTMPAGGGLRVAEKIRTFPKTSMTPIIFLSASKDPEIREKAMGHGPHAFLDKPYDPEVLLSQIQQAMGLAA